MENVLVETKYFKWIVVEILLQTVIYFVFNFMAAGPRGSMFNKQFMEQFRAEFDGADPPGGGVPDTGTGRFSKQLALRDWQRYNALQFMASQALQLYVGTVLLTAVLGVYSSVTGLVFGGGLILLRIVSQVLGLRSPGLLSFLEPLNHIAVLAGLATAAGFAYSKH